MGGQPLTVSQAWQAYGAFRRLPEVLLADEPEGCEAWLERWAMGNRPTPRQWTDAYLAPSRGRADCGSFPSMGISPTSTASICFTWRCSRAAGRGASRTRQNPRMVRA
jgi:hypothetical protein